MFGNQVNEEASDKVLEVEQKYNEIRRPVYNKRNDIIQNIPDFWLTAVSGTWLHVWTFCCKFCQPLHLLLFVICVVKITCSLLGPKSS